MSYPFERKIDRHVQQRTGWRDLHVVGATPRDHRLQPIEQRRQVGAPDIAAVDDAERQHQALWRFRQHALFE